MAGHDRAPSRHQGRPARPCCSPVVPCRCRCPVGGGAGAAAVLAADWLGRGVIFPYQVPAGLLASVIGGPFLLWLLGRR
ncbi:iron chelate uptake ABC transporter family permease subunit [Azospirillum brasilense]|uniref:Iron ABC transporter permease n=1 Tax=Azospirillum brasilense TaxID=192 RepID=A0A235HEF2_AZOBR|nr:iron chelate uptake ABC transporter family permease subunit [Azospirillum brasilense]OYD83854.1 hypothetical protein CHT98_13805 [Azospirillum brasilense]